EAAPDTILVSAPPALVASATATFEFRAEPPGASFQCELDGGGFSPCTSPHVLASLPDGSRRFAVRAVGAGGADPSPALHAWTVDTTAPGVTITAGPTGAVDDTTPTFTFSVTGAPTVTECAIDTGGFAACTSPYTTIGLAQGTHTVHVRARDAAGNQSPVTSRAFTVDTISPTVTITGGPAEDELVVGELVTFSFIATDATALTRECRIYRVGNLAPAYTTCASPRTFDVGGGSNIVQLRFQVRATDAAGNATTVTRTFRQGVPAG
ncbi:MAG: Ig-like domain repeat protein, partial [Deltaproteobacteria bacterium]|nr:Ig-like domain repeat protein [Kofleriaceae bacterium]